MMTPIPAVVTVDLSETVRDALQRCVSTGHSRLVVTEDGNQDRVKGIVHVNQLVKLMMREGGEGRFDALVREWLPLTYALNAVNRSMGRDDLYPFTLAPTVIDKLAFVHDRVLANRAGS